MSWDQAVVRYSRLVMSIGVSSGLGRADAEDVLQRTWSVALSKRDEPPPPGEIEPWLVRIARWTVHDVRRRRRPDPLRPDLLDELYGGGDEVPLELASRLEREQIVREALDDLPDRDRQVLFELFLSPEPGDYAAAAARLRVAPNGIGSMRRRALDRLRAALHARGIDS